MNTAQAAVTTNTIQGEETVMTTKTGPALDERRMGTFTERMASIYVDAMTTMMIHVGHATGLFEAAARAPATSEELARRAGLSERYVREWLGALTTARIFDLDPHTGCYTLPAEHAALLTGETAMNMAPISPMATHLAHHVDAVIEAFRTGAGVPYQAYRPGFTDAMDEINRRLYDEALVGRYLPLAPDLVERLDSGLSVADLGCGTGHCTNLMARAFPASEFVGYDVADDALERARTEATAWGLTNARFDHLDVATLPSRPRHQLICAFDAVHDQADPAGVLARARAALDDDGTFFMVDINAASSVEENRANPLAPWLYSVSVLHCMSVSLAEGGAGLGTAWGQQLARSMLADAGFADVSVHELADDPFNLVYVCRP